MAHGWRVLLTRVQAEKLVFAAAHGCAGCSSRWPGHGIAFDGTGDAMQRLVEAFWAAGKVVSGECRGG